MDALSANTTGHGLRLPTTSSSTSGEGDSTCSAPDASSVRSSEDAVSNIAIPTMDRGFRVQ